MVELIESLKEFATNPGVLITGVLTLIQIAPIKIDPWTWLLSWIGSKLNAEDRKAIQELSKEVAEVKMEVTDMKHEIEYDKATEKRWHILDFVNSCRNKRRHTREEWNHVISELKEYEEWTEQKNIPNGVIEEDGKYLRQLFQECNRNNDFL